MQHSVSELEFFKNMLRTCRDYLQQFGYSKWQIIIKKEFEENERFFYMDVVPSDNLDWCILFFHSCDEVFNKILGEFCSTI